MFNRLVVLGVLLLTPLISAATPQDCPPDNKLLGSFQISTTDAPDTLWGTTRAGLAAAGVDVTDDDAVLEILNELMGAEFLQLDDAIDVLVEGARPWDLNENDYVCLFSLRGTRANLRDPLYKFYTFGISDDKHAVP